MVKRGKEEVVIEFRGAAKSFGGFTAVRDLRIAIRAGEMYGLIGPNGSGKTTTVKMAAGLYRPTGGSVRICGIDMAGAPTKAKSHIGYVPDDPAAYDELSGREFLEFVGEIRGMERGYRDSRIASLLEVYRISGIADLPFGSYSRGNRQKISFIGALLHDPDVLLVDEPMVGLDPESARVTADLLTQFTRGGGAVLLSTHSLAIAERICDRFGLLKNGRLAAEGTAAVLRARAGRAASLEDAYLVLTRAS